MGTSGNTANMGITSPNTGTIGIGECKDYHGRVIQNSMHFVPPGNFQI